MAFNQWANPTATGAIGNMNMSTAPVNPLVPIQPNPFTTNQFSAMQPNQQFVAAQQNWQQWQAYQQQYAQWHAQYGEQYEREMQAKLGTAPPALPGYIPPMAATAAYPTVAYPSYVPQVAPQTQFAPPPPPHIEHASFSSVSLKPPPPPPPPRNELDSEIEKRKPEPVMPVLQPQNDPVSFDQNFKGLPNIQSQPNNWGQQNRQNNNSNNNNIWENNQAFNRGNNWNDNRNSNSGNVRGNSNFPNRYADDRSNFTNNPTNESARFKDDRSNFPNNPINESARFKDDRSNFPNNPINESARFKDDRSNFPNNPTNESARFKDDRNNFPNNPTNESPRFKDDRSNFPNNPINESPRFKDDRSNFPNNPTNESPRFKDDRSNFPNNPTNESPRFKDDRSNFPNNPINESARFKDGPIDKSSTSSNAHCPLPVLDNNIKPPTTSVNVNSELDAISMEREEEIFDEQFKSWQMQFDQWKATNANHPDKKSYLEYEQKFEDCRKKLIERREHMRKRKMEKQRKLSSADEKPKEGFDKLQNRDSPKKMLNTFDESNPPAAKHRRTRFEQLSDNKPIILENKLLVDGSVPKIDSTSSNKPPEMCELFKKSGGIPGLDLVIEDIIETSSGNSLEANEIIDLDCDQPSTKPNDITKNIPSLFSITVEKPTFSPPLSQADKKGPSSYVANEDNLLNTPMIPYNKEVNQSLTNMPPINSTIKSNLVEDSTKSSFGAHMPLAQPSIPAADITKVLEDPKILEILSTVLSSSQENQINPAVLVQTLMAAGQTNQSNHPWVNQSQMQQQQQQPQQQPQPWANPISNQNPQPWVNNIPSSPWANQQPGTSQQWNNNQQNNLQSNRNNSFRGNSNNRNPFGNNDRGFNSNFNNDFNNPDSNNMFGRGNNSQGNFGGTNSANYGGRNSDGSFGDRNFDNRGNNNDGGFKDGNNFDNRGNNFDNRGNNFDNRGNNNEGGFNDGRNFDNRGNNNTDMHGSNGNFGRGNQNNTGRGNNNRRFNNNDNNSNNNNNPCYNQGGGRMFAMDNNDRNNFGNNYDGNDRGNDNNTGMNRFNNFQQQGQWNTNNRGINPFRPQTSTSRNNDINENDNNDSVFRPVKVIDYQNKSLNNPSMSSPNMATPPKVVDYGHKSTGGVSNRRNENFSNSSNTSAVKKTIDYGHGSATKNVQQKNSQELYQRKRADNPFRRKDQNASNNNRMKQNDDSGNNMDSQNLDFRRQPDDLKRNERNYNYNDDNSNSMDYISKVHSNDESQVPNETQQNDKSSQQSTPRVAFNENSNSKLLDDADLENISDNEIDPFESYQIPSPSKDQNKNKIQTSPPTPPPPPQLFASDQEQLSQDIKKNAANKIQTNIPCSDNYTKPQTQVASTIPIYSNAISSMSFVEKLKPIFPSTQNHITLGIDEIISSTGRLMRPKKIVIILRGPPGSGKSYVAKLIKQKESEMGGSAPRILSIDDYYLIENDKESVCPKTGKKIIEKVMVYEYEAGMEDTYMQNLIKSFKKTLADNFFDFIIVDCSNHLLRTLNEFYSLSKDVGFTPYVIDLFCDLKSCLKNNVHNRSENDIKKILDIWMPTPFNYVKLDVQSLIKDDEIQEIEMEDDFHMGEEEQPIGTDESTKDSTEDVENIGFLKSKWDTDTTGEKLARLDGTSKPFTKRQNITLEDYLQIDGWQPSSQSASKGKKRVRWADIEEKRELDKMRAIGFVVGQTDWNRMMDPTSGSSALTKTKYIERCNNKRRL